MNIKNNIIKIITTHLRADLRNRNYCAVFMKGTVGIIGLNVFLDSHNQTLSITIFKLSNFLNNIQTYHAGLSPKFWSNFIKNSILIGISSNFLHNISTCICIRKCNKNEEFSPSDF